MLFIYSSMLAAQKTAESVTALAKNGQATMDAIEASTKPVVAAIMGACLGGGNEVLCFFFLFNSIFYVYCYVYFPNSRRLCI